MSVVLDTCTLVDLNNLDESSPRYQAVARVLDNEACHVTPIVAAEIYKRLRDDISLERAEAVLSVMKTGDPVRIADDSELIELAVEARDCGVPFSIAFSAALARNLAIPIFTNESIFDVLDEAGFCEIRRY